MRFVKQIIRGCGDLPYFGPHPGTGFLFGFIGLGALAGVEHGIRAGIVGALIMGVGMGAIYLGGAYSRAMDSDALVRRNGPEK